MEAKTQKTSRKNQKSARPGNRTARKVGVRQARAKKAVVRSKPQVAAKKAVSKKPVRKADPGAERPTMVSAEPTSTEPKPQAFFDPKGGRSDFGGDTKGHTKPEDQRAHIRMQAPRTWSNRQPGRG